MQDNLDDSFNIDVETGNNLQFIQDQVNDANQVPEQAPAQIQVNVPLQAQELNQALRRTARVTQPISRLNVNPNRKTYRGIYFDLLLIFFFCLVSIKIYLYKRK